jgi:hypothetical protein
MLRSRCGTVFHISDLVQLATLDHWVVGHVDHGLAQRLGPVDPDEHRARERMRWGMLPRIRGPCSVRDVYAGVRHGGRNLTAELTRKPAGRVASR